MFLGELDRQEKEAFLELAHLAAQSDGIMHDAEMELLARYRTEMGLSEDDVPSERPLAEIIDRLRSRRVRNIAFIEVLALILLDGDYHENEKALLAELKNGFGISPEYYERCKAWIRKINAVYEEGFGLIDA